MKTVFAVLVLLATDPIPSPLPLELGFLHGCWAGEVGNEYLEEQYGSAHGGMLLGSVKTSRGERVSFFEFLRIYADAAGVWLQPYPSGRGDAPRFRLIELEADKATFENSAHDFPRRISYRLLPDGELLTRVAGVVNGASVVEEYVTLPRDCTP